MAIPVVLNFDTNQIPVEGSSTFRSDASYVWGRIPPVIDSMNAAIAVQNVLSDNLTTSEANAAASATAAKASEDIAVTSAEQAEAAVSSLPEGTIDDAMIATDKAWSSEKIANDKQDTLVSGTNIKTVGGNSILGAGDMTVGVTDYQEFTTSGTWTKPEGISYVYVEAIGGGGGGGAVNNAAGVSAGGGAGGCGASKLFISSDVPATVSVTIGAGGAVGTPDGIGNVGGDTIFDTLIAKGGNGGQYDINSFALPKSSASLVKYTSIDIVFMPIFSDAGYGGARVGSSDPDRLQGGNCILGGGGGGGTYYDNNYAHNSNYEGQGGNSINGGKGGLGAYAGTDGEFPGGGGGGCCGTFDGGNGADGIVKIWCW